MLCNPTKHKASRIVPSDERSVRRSAGIAIEMSMVTLLILSALGMLLIAMAMLTNDKTVKSAQVASDDVVLHRAVESFVGYATEVASTNAADSITVPDVRGWTLDDARDYVKEQGFRVRVEGQSVVDVAAIEAIEEELYKSLHNDSLEGFTFNADTLDDIADNYRVVVKSISPVGETKAAEGSIVTLTCKVVKVVYTCIDNSDQSPQNLTVTQACDDINDLIPQNLAGHSAEFAKSIIEHLGFTLNIVNSDESVTKFVLEVTYPDDAYAQNSYGFILDAGNDKIALVDFAKAIVDNTDDDDDLQAIYTAAVEASGSNEAKPASFTIKLPLKKTALPDTIAIGQKTSYILSELDKKGFAVTCEASESDQDKTYVYEIVHEYSDASTRTAITLSGNTPEYYVGTKFDLKSYAKDTFDSEITDKPSMRIQLSWDLQENSYTINKTILELNGITVDSNVLIKSETNAFLTASDFDFKTHKATLTSVSYGDVSSGTATAIVSGSSSALIPWGTAVILTFTVSNVEVPNVIGMTADKAKNALESNFTVRYKVGNNDTSTDSLTDATALYFVTEASVSGGSSGLVAIDFSQAYAPTTVITLTLSESVPKSDDQFAMPDLTGYTYSAAKTILANCGFSVETSNDTSPATDNNVYAKLDDKLYYLGSNGSNTLSAETANDEKASEIASSIVSAQSIAEGSLVSAEGVASTWIILTLTQQIDVPYVVGMTYAEAKAEIEAAGLQCAFSGAQGSSTSDATAAITAYEGIGAIVVSESFGENNSSLTWDNTTSSTDASAQLAEGSTVTLKIGWDESVLGDGYLGVWQLRSACLTDNADVSNGNDNNGSNDSNGDNSSTADTDIYSWLEVKDAQYNTTVLYVCVDKYGNIVRWTNHRD